MQLNKMKAKLAAGEPALGLSVMIPSPQVIEMAGGLGFDWVLIDCEHGTITRENAELMIIAAEASGVTPIVRPRSNTAQDIIELMDLGYMYYVLKWLGPLGGWIFRRGMYRKYYE